LATAPLPRTHDAELLQAAAAGLAAIELYARRVLAAEPYWHLGETRVALSNIAEQARETRAELAASPHVDSRGGEAR
jgi:hypothetical protein